MATKFRRRRLPHLDKPGSIYFVTTCLAGSIPAKGLSEISDYRLQLEQRQKPDPTSPDWNRTKFKLVFAKMDSWLDNGLAVSHFKNPDLARETEAAILHFAPERYTLWAWVVMSNHIHWVFEPNLEWEKQVSACEENARTSREIIMHSLKRHTAKQCNQLLKRSGKFWQDESYDHCIDSVTELERVINYVEENPVRQDSAMSPKTSLFLLLTFVLKMKSLSANHSLVIRN